MQEVLASMLKVPATSMRLVLIRTETIPANQQQLAFKLGSGAVVSAANSAALSDAKDKDKTVVIKDGKVELDDVSRTVKWIGAFKGI